MNPLIYIGMILASFIRFNVSTGRYYASLAAFVLSNIWFVSLVNSSDYKNDPYYPYSGLDLFTDLFLGGLAVIISVGWGLILINRIRTLSRRVVVGVILVHIPLVNLFYCVFTLGIAPETSLGEPRIERF